MSETVGYCPMCQATVNSLWARVHRLTEERDLCEAQIDRLSVELDRLRSIIETRQPMENT